MRRLANFFRSLGTPRPPRLSADGRVLRFDIHQRLQHVLMFTSLMTLVLTGWPLKAAGVGISRHLATALGGVENIAVIHRTAAVVMLLACVYHIGYLTLLAARKQLQYDIVPGPQDLKDIAANIRYYLGLQPEPPKFGRFSYFEKFDYWAVFWGIFIIGGSGLVLWFPVKATAILPGWVVNVAFIAHSDEALLALMYLFIFHFYMVHLRPAIFPMSWVWVDGRMSLTEYRHEHALDFARIPTEDLKAAAEAAKARGDQEAEAVLAPPVEVEAEAPPTEAAADTPPAEAAADAPPAEAGTEEPAKKEDDDASGR